MGLWDLYTKFPIFRFYLHNYMNDFVQYIEQKVDYIGSIFRVLMELIYPLAMLTDGLTWVGGAVYGIFCHVWNLCAFMFWIIKSPFELFYGIVLWPAVSICKLLKWIVEYFIIGYPMALVTYTVNLISTGCLTIFSCFSLIGKTISAWISMCKNVIFPAV